MKFIRWTVIIIAAVTFAATLLELLLGNGVESGQGGVLILWGVVFSIAVYSEYVSKRNEKHPNKHKTKDRVVTDK